MEISSWKSSVSKRKTRFQLKSLALFKETNEFVIAIVDSNTRSPRLESGSIRLRTRGTSRINFESSPPAPCIKNNDLNKNIESSLFNRWFQSETLLSNWNRWCYNQDFLIEIIGKSLFPYENLASIRLRTWETCKTNLKFPCFFDFIFVYVAIIIHFLYSPRGSLYKNRRFQHGNPHFFIEIDDFNNKYCFPYRDL